VGSPLSRNVRYLRYLGYVEREGGSVTKRIAPGTSFEVDARKQPSATLTILHLARRDDMFEGTGCRPEKEEAPGQSPREPSDRPTQ
jgi:hypothetical protein